MSDTPEKQATPAASTKAKAKKPATTAATEEAPVSLEQALDLFDQARAILVAYSRENLVETIRFGSYRANIQGSTLIDIRAA